MTTAIRTYSIAEFMALPDNGKEYELVRGELIEMPGPNFTHGKVIVKLSRYLESYTEGKELGQAISGSAFVIDPLNQTARRPDIGFLTPEHLSGWDFDEAVPFPPDLAIEVVSPTDTEEGVDDKLDEYRAAGVKLVWVIRPRRKIVEVYRLGSTKVELLNLDDELDGENLIPGFKLKVSKLFE